MTYLVQENLALIIAAIVIGFIIGWWIWSRRRIAPPVILNEDASRPTFARNAAPEPFVTPTRPEAEAEEALAASLLSIDPVSGIVAPPIMPIGEPLPVVEDRAGSADNLLLMKGVGPKLAVLLNGLGVTSFQQIADWTPADIARIDPQLGSFKGRIERDRWVEQARLLARGDIAAFEQGFGKAGVPA